MIQVVPISAIQCYSLSCCLTGNATQCAAVGLSLCPSAALAPDGTIPTVSGQTSCVVYVTVLVYLSFYWFVLRREWMSIQILTQSFNTPIATQMNFAYLYTITVLRRMSFTGTCATFCSAFMPTTTSTIPPFGTNKCCESDLCNNLVIYSSETPPSATERLHGMTIAQCQSETGLIF